MHCLAPQPALARRPALADSVCRTAFGGFRTASACFHGTRPLPAATHPARTARLHCTSTTTQAAAAQKGKPVAPLLGGRKEDALLLAWFASKNRSLFATQCFVETVLECYQHGVIVDELEMALQLRNLQSEPRVLQPLEQDVILTWMLLIMLTLRHLGVPFTPAADAAEAASADQQRSASNAQASSSSSSSSSGSGGGAGQALPDDDDPYSKQNIAVQLGNVTRRHTQEVVGLLEYVRTNLRNYINSQYSLQGVQSLHYAIARFPDQKPSMFQELMQQYTVLILCTLEVAVVRKLPIKSMKIHPLSVKASLGYVAAFTGQHPPQQLQQGQTDQQQLQSDPMPEVRSAAVRLLVAFMGAVLDSTFSKQRFALYASQAYDDGISASQLYNALEPAEFKQLGLLLPTAEPDLQEEERTGVNSQLFANWLSTTYMVFAQMGVVFPAAKENSSSKGGWAWAGAGDEVEANALAAFVAAALKRAADEAKSSWLDQPPEDPLAAKLRAVPEAAQAMKAEQRAAAEEMREHGTLRGKPMPSMTRLPDQKLGATSPAVLVWRQQLELVDNARKLVLAAVEQQDATG